MTEFCINVNNLPAGISIGGLTPINVHWHKDPWPMNATKTYLTQAFSNGVAEEYKYNSILCLDIEPIELWDYDGEKFQKALNITTSAGQRMRSVFKNRRYMAYDYAGGRSITQAIANCCAARSAADGLNDIVFGLYPEDDGRVNQPIAHMLFDAYCIASARCWPMPNVGVFVSHRKRGDGEPIGLDLFRENLKFAKSLNPATVGLWQADRYFCGGDEEAALKILNPYVELMKEQVPA